MKLISKETNYEVKLKEYKSEQEIEVVKQEATVYYNRLYKRLKENNADMYQEPLLIPSFIARKYTYFDTQENSGLLYGMEKIYNHNYTKIFIAKLKELAKEKGLFIEVKIVYDEEVESYFISSTLENGIYFKKKFDLSLEDYYKAEEGKETPLGEYEDELIKLRETFIKYLVKDKEAGFDGELAQHDAYMGFLMLNNKYKELIGKDVVADQIFEIDSDRQLLKLKK